MNPFTIIKLTRLVISTITISDTEHDGQTAFWLFILHIDSNHFLFYQANYIIAFAGDKIFLSYANQ